MPRRGSARGRRLKLPPLPIIAVALVALAVGLLTIHEKHDGEMAPTGRPVIIDGDTLRFGSSGTVRIVGIDAPEADQTCRDAAGVEWRCGVEATSRLRELVGRQSVWCKGDEHDRYGRLLAICTVGPAVDLGEAMVRSGMALATGRYAAAEREARAEKAGIWSGEFDLPRTWRDRAAFDLWTWISSWFG